jgi:hypothetical protein
MNGGKDSSKRELLDGNFTNIRFACEERQAERKERFLVTHEQRNHTFWRVKAGAAPTVQSTRVRA